LPEIDGQQARGKEVAFRGDAAFAKPEIYESVEEHCSVRSLEVGHDKPHPREQLPEVELHLRHQACGSVCLPAASAAP
jgi:hypothetical protein